jgi:hypothetical protein
MGSIPLYGVQQEVTVVALPDCFGLWTIVAVPVLLATMLETIEETVSATADGD